MRTDKPKLRHVLRLRCPHCGVTPLRAEGAWLRFREGCPDCDYRYEREPGYFWGSAWIVTYTVASFAAFGLAVWMLVVFPKMDALVIALIAVAPIVPLAVLLTPFSRALWMWADHLLHPLDPDEKMTLPAPM